MEQGDANNSAHVCVLAYMVENNLDSDDRMGRKTNSKKRERRKDNVSKCKLNSK